MAITDCGREDLFCNDCTWASNGHYGSGDEEHLMSVCYFFTLLLCYSANLLLCYLLLFLMIVIGRWMMANACTVASLIDGQWQ